MRLAQGSTLGPYAIRAQLGAGGLGVVYTAHDPRPDRQMATKVLPPDLIRDDTAQQRFFQGAPFVRHRIQSSERQSSAPHSTRFD